MATTDAPPKIKLYWLDSSRSQRILWLLEELKLDYEVEIFHRNKTTMLAPPELAKVHPLGKSPVLTITPAGSTEPITLAESGWMTQYLCDHFPEGSRLVPPRWKAGLENKVGGESEAWMRYNYLLHYAEGSLMPILVMALVIGRLKSPDEVPFFVRPITSIIANRIFSAFIFPNAKKHVAFIDQQLQTAGGKYLCHDKLTAADILMSFPLIAAKNRFDEMGKWEGGSWKTAYPRVLEYVERLEAEPGYKKSIEKIKELNNGEFSETLG